MNRCAYCGKENENALGNCPECGTPFRPETKASPSPFDLLRTRTGTAVSTVAAILLICGGLFFLTGTAGIQLGILFSQRPPHMSPSAKILLTSRVPGLLIALVAVVPVVGFCRTRFSPLARAHFIAGTTLAGVGALAAAPWLSPLGMVFWCPPVFFLVRQGPAVCYAAAIAQVLIGVFYLRWLRPGK